MALQSMEDGEDLRTIEDLARSVFIPFGVCIINHHTGRHLRRRGVCKGISGITPIDLVPHLSSKGKENSSWTSCSMHDK
jgi:hypothetical protein